MEGVWRDQVRAAECLNAMAERTRIMISRTDNIGDVVLALPLAGIIRRSIPDCEIWFVGRSYTRDVVDACVHVDHFVDREEIVGEPEVLKRIGPDAILLVYPDREVAWAAKRAGIRLRIGTSHRLLHWFTCNRLIHFSRKNSREHEAVLNQRLLSPLQIPAVPKEEIKDLYGLTRIGPLPEPMASLISETKCNVVIHPKSRGHAREWPLERYCLLAGAIAPEKFNVLLTGNQAEGEMIRRQSPEIARVAIDLTGKLKLGELISLLARCNGIVSSSTGPLHLAAALRRNTCGIFPAAKAMHPARWAPLGERAGFLLARDSCLHCNGRRRCRCVREISVEQVQHVVQSWAQTK